MDLIIINKTREENKLKKKNIVWARIDARRPIRMAAAQITPEWRIIYP